jgi:hypothetical protein
LFLALPATIRLGGKSSQDVKINLTLWSSKLECSNRELLAPCTIHNLIEKVSLGQILANLTRNKKIYRTD